MGEITTGTGKTFTTPYNTIKTPINEYEKLKKKKRREPTYEELKQLPSTEEVNRNKPSTPEPTPSQPVYNEKRYVNSPVQKVEASYRQGTAGQFLRASREATKQGYTFTIDRPEFNDRTKYVDSQGQVYNIRPKKEVQREEPKEQTFTQESYSPSSQVAPKQKNRLETYSTGYNEKVYPLSIDMTQAKKEFKPELFTAKRTTSTSETINYKQEVTPFIVNVDLTKAKNEYSPSKEYTPKIDSPKDLVNISKLKEEGSQISLGQESLTQFKKGNIVFGTVLAGTSTVIGGGKGVLGTLEFFSPYSIQQRKFQIPVLTPAKDMVLSLPQLPAYAKREPFEFTGLLVGGYATGKIINPYLPKLKQGTTIFELDGEGQSYSVVKTLAIEQGKNSFIIGSTKRKYTSDVSFSSENIPKEYTITSSGDFKEGLIVSDAPTKGVKQNPVDRILFSNPDPFVVANELDFANKNTFVGEVPSQPKFNVFSRSPDILPELRQIRDTGLAGEGLRISTPTETKMVNYAFKRASTSELDNPLRDRGFIDVTQNIIEPTYSKTSKFDYGFDKKTQFLNEEGTNILLDVAKNSRKYSQEAFINEPLTYYGTEAGVSSGKLFQFKRKSSASGSGKSFVSGSFARMPELSKDYTYKNIVKIPIGDFNINWAKKVNYKLNKVPKDLDIHVEGSPEVVQNLADLSFQRLKAKGFDVRQTGEGGIVKNAIEIKFEGKWEKAVEFLGEGTIPDAEVPPDFVVGFKKEGAKTKTLGVTRTTLAEELRGTVQGLARVRKIDGKLAIYPREGRLKDVASVSVSARSLQQSFNPYSKKAFKLQRNIETFESFYPDDVVREQVMLPESKVVADFRPSTWKSKYYDWSKSTVNLQMSKKEVFESSKYKMVSPSRIISPTSLLSVSKASSSRFNIPSISLSSSRISSKSASRSSSRSKSKSNSLSKSISNSLSKSLSLSPSLSKSPSFSPSLSPSASKSTSRSPSPSRLPSISRPPLIISKSFSKSLKLSNPFPKVKQSKSSFNLNLKQSKQRLFILPSLKNVFIYEAQTGKEAIMPYRTKRVKTDFENQYLGKDIYGSPIPVFQLQKKYR